MNVFQITDEQPPKLPEMGKDISSALAVNLSNHINNGISTPASTDSSNDGAVCLFACFRNTFKSFSVILINFRKKIFKEKCIVSPNHDDLFCFVDSVFDRRSFVITQMRRFFSFRIDS